MKDITVRDATIADTETILRFIRELAIYENAGHEVTANEEDIRSSLFEENASAHAIMGYLNKEPSGFAVYFFNYSTWMGKSGIFLEDLYVSPNCRGSGLGKAILRHIANVAILRNCSRFEWNVLHWNEPAIKFYQSLGASPQSEWVGYRLEGQSLIDLASPHTAC